MFPPKMALHLVRCWDSDGSRSDAAAAAAVLPAENNSLGSSQLAYKKGLWNSSHKTMELRSTNMAASNISSIAFLSL